MSGKQQTIDNKEATLAPGAESTSKQNTGGLTDLERSELTSARNEALLDSQSVDPGAPNYLDPVVIVETPTWVGELLASNLATQSSNQLVIDALAGFKGDVADFKEGAADFVKELIKQTTERLELLNTPKESTVAETSVSKFDPALDYFVAAGKEFRAPSDFNVIHKEGHNVNHLGTAKLQSLLDQGLVIGLETED